MLLGMEGEVGDVPGGDAFKVWLPTHASSVLRTYLSPNSYIYIQHTYIHHFHLMREVILNTPNLTVWRCRQHPVHRGKLTFHELLSYTKDPITSQMLVIKRKR